MLFIFQQSPKDVMLVKCKLEDMGEMVEKTYTYSDLKDLQRKLPLVAGEQQKDNKQIILEFDAVNKFVLFAK